MNYRKEYPENRLNIRVDECGNVFFEENKEFKKYYAPTLEELEEEMEELKDDLALMNLDEPDDLCSIEHDDWEDEMDNLQEKIRDIEEAIAKMK